MTKDSDVHLIAKPLLDSEDSKKMYKAIGKAVKSKKVFYGSKTVNKMIRKGTKGICVLAGDTTPIDVISHYPMYCEEMDIPCVFVNNRNNLGEACESKRGIAVVLIQKPTGKEDYAESYEKMEKLIKKMK